ncbi:hypothetical protein FRC04_009428 [Tulasnella sp. 424]|nr:hypothetical protein FRC04_009428 [Tulasnella sp. 424]KAG8971882.1 hypothetical protein FRC05_010550 [Tulasnella sp. 425]
MTSNQTSIEITYSFDLPSGVASPASSTSQSSTHTYSFDVQKGAGNSEAYYDSFLQTLKKARDVTGKDLTAWRDAVGDAEKNKEVALKKPPSDEDEDEDDEGAE